VERDELRAEVAALQREIGSLDAQLAESTRNANIVATISGLVQQMGTSATASIGSAPPTEDNPAGNAPEPAVDTRGLNPTPLTFLELWDVLGAGGEAAAPAAKPAPDLQRLAPVGVVEQKRTEERPLTVPLAIRAPRGAGRWLSRLFAWASVAAVAFAVALVLAITAGPRVLPYQTFYVYGRSMEPTISVGSMVVLSPVSFDQVQVGDVITVERPDAPGALVTHRVIAFEETPDGVGLVTQGDANATPDPWRVGPKGDGYRLLFSVPYLGYVLYVFQSPIGRFALLIIPAIALGSLLLVQLWRPRRPAGATLAAS
jgi:signal peptidase